VPRQQAAVSRKGTRVDVGVVCEDGEEYERRGSAFAGD
jgi:hypothetical protein